MLTQKTPFDAEYEQAIGYGILNEDPKPVTALRSGLPTEIDRLIDKSLAKDPAERYQNADDLLADLLVLQRQSGAHKTASGRSRTMAECSAAATVGSAGADSILVPKRRLHIERAILALAALAALSVSYAYFFAPATEVIVNRPVSRFSFPVEVLDLARISPGGKYIAYAVGEVRNSSLWLRSLATDSVR